MVANAVSENFLDETFPTVPGACLTQVHTHARTHACSNDPSTLLDMRRAAEAPSQADGADEARNEEHADEEGQAGDSFIAVRYI